ncbi:MAG: hypothetical protein ACK5N8_08295 [Alphaproteobacteria bacterium]
MEMQDGPIIPTKCEDDSERFLYENAGTIKQIEYVSTSQFFVEISTRHGSAAYLVQHLSFKYASGDEVKILKDMKTGNYFIGKRIKSDKSLIKAYFIFTVCDKFFYLVLLLLVAITCLGFPFLKSLYDGFEMVVAKLFFWLALIVTLGLLNILSMYICLQFGKYAYRKYEKS